MTDRRKKRVLVVIPWEVQMDAGLGRSALGIQPRCALPAEKRRGFEQFDLEVLRGRQQHVSRRRKTGNPAPDDGDTLWHIGEVRQSPNLTQSFIVG